MGFLNPPPALGGPPPLFAENFFPPGFSPRRPLPGAPPPGPFPPHFGEFSRGLPRRRRLPPPFSPFPSRSACRHRIPGAPLPPLFPFPPPFLFPRVSGSWIAACFFVNCCWGSPGRNRALVGALPPRRGAPGGPPGFPGPGVGPLAPPGGPGGPGAHGADPPLGPRSWTERAPRPHFRDGPPGGPEKGGEIFKKIKIKKNIHLKKNFKLQRAHIWPFELNLGTPVPNFLKM